MTYRALSVFVAILVISGGAIASDHLEPGFYLGAGYSALTYSEKDISDGDLGVLFARGGYLINDYLAAEVRVGGGVLDDTVHGFGASAKVKLNSIYGAYLKAGLPTEIGFYPYALIGATHLKLTAKDDSSGGGHFSSHDGDLSYGFGVDYWFNKELSAGVEYMQYYDKKDVQFFGVALGANFKF